MSEPTARDSGRRRGSVLRLRRWCSPRTAAGRAIHAVGVSILLLWTQACTVMRPLASGQPARPQAIVRANAPAGVILATPVGALTAAPLCRATVVEGQVDRQVGDTLVFGRVYRAAAAPESASCPRMGGAAALVRTSDVSLSERQVSKGRTTALVVGLVVAVLAVAAYAASQIEYDFSQAGSGGYSRVR